MLALASLAVAWFKYRNESNLFKLTHIEGEVDCLRDGPQTKLHRVVLLAEAREVAQARVLRVRRLDTPVVPVPHDYPAPDDVPEGKGPPTARMAGAIRHRMVSGQPGEPGRAVAWLALDGEIISGACPANFV